jgi:hypothetical protein
VTIDWVWIGDCIYLSTLTHDSWLHLIIAPSHRWSPHFTNHYSTRWSFSVCCVFTSRFLVTGSNSGDSSASALTSLLSGEYPTSLCTELNSKLVPLITFRHGSTENTALLLFLQSFPWKHVCLRRCYYVMAVYICLLRICCLAADVSLFVSWLLSSNGSSHFSTNKVRWSCLCA